MAIIDLITGFLGSGKTTFIKEYASHLISQGLKIGILVNDYGAVNVDMMLLQELEGDQCELQMVAGACDLHCHKRRFKSKLISMGMFGYDRVIVEPSGIFDVDEFFDVVHEDPIDRFYEIGSVISVIDAGMERDLSEQGEYLLLSQTACAGAAVLSKVQLTDPEYQEETIDFINRILTKNRCPALTDSRIHAKEWSRYEEKDWVAVMNAGYTVSAHKKLHLEDDSDFRSLYFMNLSPSLEEAREGIKRLFACFGPASLQGQVLRVKGFLKDGDQWYELNAARKDLSVKETGLGQDVFVIIGIHLNEDQVRACFAGKTL